ncbi:MAG: S8 family peptidase, partial [Acidobacteriota bacterium]
MAPPSRFRLFGLIGLGVAVLLVAQPASAQYRARLSRGLESRIADGASSVTVVVTAPQAEVERLASTYGLRVSKRLDQGAVLSGSSTQINRAAGDSNVGALAEDDLVISTMAVTTQSTGASLLWAGNGGKHFDGLTGQGIGVAVIDSGIAPHPDVANRLALSLDFTNEEGVADGFGHGTHLAGIISGSGRGSQSGDGTAYVGMAPGASLLSLRVLGSDGTGYVSDVIQAIEWAVKNKDRYKIRILNLSLGHATTDRYQDDPLAQAVERAVRSGLVVVASAGNLGKTADGTPVIGAIVSPGYTPGALTVGALNTKGTVARSDDGVATYSSRGPVGDPDDSSTWEIKPDLVAPGNAITSTGQPGTLLWDNFPERHVTGASGGNYLTLSGASMSTAVVSGAVAQLLQLQPKLTPGEVKFALQFTAERLSGFGIIEQGAGSLNVPLAAALVKAR